MFVDSNFQGLTFRGPHVKEERSKF